MKSLVLVIVLSFFLMTGCGTERDTADRITMWHVGTEAESQIIERLANQYFYPETGIRVRCDAISWGEAHTRYLTSVVGGVAPDIGTMGLTWATEFGHRGAMVDMREAFPEDTITLRDSIFPSIWNSAQWGEKVYGIPFDLTVKILYYRNDIIPDPPKNWDELTTLLEDISAEDKRMIIGWGSLDWLGYSPFLWQAGGDFYNPAGTRSALDQPEAVKALKFYESLYNKYNVPRSGENFAEGLGSGQNPLGYTGNWLLNRLDEEMPELRGKWSIAMLPAGSTGRGTSILGGRAIGIFDQSDLKDEAWEFIKFLASEDTQEKIYVEVAERKDIFLPPNISVWDRLPMKEEHRSVLVSQIMEAKGPPPVLGWGESTRHIVENIQQVILQGRDPEKALADSARKMNEMIITQ